MLILAAPLLGVEWERTGLIIGLFALTGVIRALDETRMRSVEAASGWDRKLGLRGKRTAHKQGADQ
jgi:hypothetical protein